MAVDVNLGMGVFSLSPSFGLVCYEEAEKSFSFFCVGADLRTMSMPTSLLNLRICVCRVLMRYRRSRLLVFVLWMGPVQAHI
jgi:hypothetical protein